MRRFKTVLNGGNNIPDSTLDDIFEESWQPILEYFDWDKVRSIMIMLGHTWGFDKRTPTIDELKHTAMLRCRTAYDGLYKYSRTYFNSASGGFFASAQIIDDREVILELNFVVEHWESETDIQNDFTTFKKWIDEK